MPLLTGEWRVLMPIDWFSTFVVGLIFREDELGVTSVVRRLGPGRQAYDSLVSLFSSGGWLVSALVVEPGRCHCLPLEAGARVGMRAASEWDGAAFP